LGRDESDNEKILREHGVIVLSGDIDDDSAERVCKDIIGYNLAGEVDQIQFLVNSPGGVCSAGFAIIDMMKWSKLPVCTAGVGMLGSMGLLVFMAGVRGRRVITSTTSILSHRFSGTRRGSHSQLLASRKEQDLLHDRIVDHYLRYTKVRSREELEQYLLRDVDTWLSPDEAIGLGLADSVEPVRQIA
jgi:ATP-dependent Clp protease protease subunit